MAIETEVQQDILAKLKLKEALSILERGNGYSCNPLGPLKPGDFGVHSHPDTEKLMKDPVGRDDPKSS